MTLAPCTTCGHGETQHWPEPDGCMLTNYHSESSFFVSCPCRKFTSKMRREIVISYDPADLPGGFNCDSSGQYDFERHLAGGAEAARWAKVPVEVEYRDVPS